MTGENLFSTHAFRAVTARYTWSILRASARMSSWASVFTPSRLAHYEQQQRDASSSGVEVDPFASASLDFGLTYERAVLDWFDRLPVTRAH